MMETFVESRLNKNIFNFAPRTFRLFEAIYEILKKSFLVFSRVRISHNSDSFNLQNGVESLLKIDTSNL